MSTRTRYPADRGLTARMLTTVFLIGLLYAVFVVRDTNEPIPAKFLSSSMTLPKHVCAFDNSPRVESRFEYLAECDIKRHFKLQARPIFESR